MGLRLCEADESTYRISFCGEILRESFYVNRWKYEECDKEVIFFSQAHYPIKGLHIMLRALPIIKEYYPAVVLRIVGNNPQKKAIFKRSSYENIFVT